MDNPSLNNHSSEQPTFLTSMRLFQISSYWLATNMLWGALLMIVLPSQMKKMAPSNPAEVTGYLISTGAIPSLFIPLLVGPFSDRCTLRWGRRRPFIAFGTGIAVLGLAVLWHGTLFPSLLEYYLGYFLVQIGNNTACGAYNSVIPDMVSSAQSGSASGWMGAISQAGTILGILSSALLIRAGYVSLIFPFLILLTLFCMALTLQGINDKPASAGLEPLTLKRIFARYWISPRTYPDFAWVWLTRAMVVMGIWTVQEYMQFYLTDIVRVPDANKEIIAGMILLIGLVFATISGLAGGAISDKVGRKKIVYVSNTCTALVFLAFLIFHQLWEITILAALFGLGYGAYYSVDWALGCDVLPNPEDSAKDMAIWHISMVLPQSLILPLSGFLLGLFGKVQIHMPNGQNVIHYTEAGYTCIFLLASIFLISGAVLLRNVRGVR